MPGPWVAAARVLDPLGAIGVQPFHMDARRFRASTFANSRGAPSAVAIVAGRPAVVIQSGPGFQFAINDQADGGGRWDMSAVLPIDWSMQGPTVDAPCPLAVWLGHPHLACAHVAKGGALVLTHATNTLPDGSGTWDTGKLIQVRSDPAPTLGAAGDGLYLAYFQDRALTLLRYGSRPLDAVVVGRGFELLWSTDVGSAPPASHSAVISVGDPPVLPAIAYLDAAKGQLVYAVNQKSDGRGRWDLVVVEPQQGDIGTPSLAMIGGRPAIAYRDGRKGYLKIAVAANPDGRGAWKVSVVDATTKPGGTRVQSLAEIDGRAGIAYEHETRGLLFAYDPERPTADYWPAAAIGAPPVPFTDGRYHLNPSLALVAGRPAIVYYSVDGMQFATAR